MPSNTTYNPPILEFDNSKIIGFGQGVGAVCGALTDTHLDLTLNDDVIITGVNLIIQGASIGDKLDLNIFNANDQVVGMPIQNWYLPTNGSVDFNLVMPQKILAGFKLRVTVHTTVILTTPFVAVNFKLWKILS